MNKWVRVCFTFGTSVWTKCTFESVDGMVVRISLIEFRFAGWIQHRGGRFMLRDGQDEITLQSGYWFLLDPNGFVICRKASRYSHWIDMQADRTCRVTWKFDFEEQSRAAAMLVLLAARFDKGSIFGQYYIDVARLIARAVRGTRNDMAWLAVY